MKLRFIIRIIQEMGLLWVFFRGLYSLYRKTGIQKLCFLSRKQDWISLSSLSATIDKRRLSDYLKNCTVSEKLLEGIRQFYSDNEAVAEKIEIEYSKLKEGKFTFFSKMEYKIGQPPDWFLNPVINRRIDPNRHWTDIDDFSSDAGDIKWVWELSRFSFVYVLVRYYVLTGDESAVQLFWRLVNDWIDKNEPEYGPHWKCGQEIAIRSIALLNGLQHFYKSENSSVENILKLIGLLRYNVLHIRKNFWYAKKCIRNNHVISEAAGMFLIGLKLQFIPEAQQLLKKGKTNLEQEAVRQIYDDGSYLQHSHNYHRLVIQIYSLCIAWGRKNNVEFSEALTNNLIKSILFLYNLQDDSTGMMPNYGNNDGALLQKLSGCDYTDYRPQLQTAYYLLAGLRLYSTGNWDENTIWLCESDNYFNSQNIKLIRKSHAYQIGGYYVMRDSQSDCYGVVRCANYQDRPAQPDMLHLDFWCSGVNVLCDPGTYAYNSNKDEDYYFFSTQYHNTVSINEHDQMERVSNFLWIDWPRCQLVEFMSDSEINIFEGICLQKSGNAHSRRIMLKNGLWWIQDRVMGHRNSAEINWNVMLKIKMLDKANFVLNSPENSIFIKTNYNLSFKKGYISRYYGCREEITHITGSHNDTSKHVIFNTFIGVSIDISTKSVHELSNFFIK